MSREDFLITGLSRHQHTARKPALAIAEEVLGSLFNPNFKGHFALWNGKRFEQATLDGVMIATNIELARQGKPQVATNPKWVVLLPANSNLSQGSDYVR